ncbi:MAG: DUF4386 domain-containing protein [Ginsengibacter sp.]
MTSNKTIARIAGLLYLIVVLMGIFHLMYVPSKLIVWNNAAITYNNISASESLFRLGILGGFVCYLAFLLLPFVLYKLLKNVNKNWSVLMVVFGVMSAPLAFINFSNEFSVLTLISKAGSLNTFGITQLQDQVLLYLGFYNNGLQIISIFSGLWLFPFGLLVYKSGFLPKILGILLMMGCFGYLVDFTAGFLSPEYNKMAISKYMILPASIGEIGICLWMLFIGVREKKNML